MTENLYTYLQCEFCLHKWKIPYTKDSEIVCPNCGDVGLKRIVLKSDIDPEWFDD